MKTNIKAVAHRGWGPKALNYNVLLHPEILATKQGAKKEGLTTGLQMNVAPEDLNLSEGLSAMLVERIVDYKVKEASRNGVGADEQRRKRKATAKKRLRSHDKRILSCLLAAAGHFHLGAEVRD